LDAISGKWYSKHPSPGYDQEKISSVGKQLKECFKAMLRKENIPQNFIDDVLATFNPQPSALHKMKKLLVDTGMCPPPIFQKDTPEHKRLKKLINSEMTLYIKVLLKLSMRYKIE